MGGEVLAGGGGRRADQPRRVLEGARGARGAAARGGPAGRREGVGGLPGKGRRAPGYSLGAARPAAAGAGLAPPGPLPLLPGRRRGRGRLPGPPGGAAAPALGRAVLAAAGAGPGGGGGGGE